MVNVAIGIIINVIVIIVNVIVIVNVIIVSVIVIIIIILITLRAVRRITRTGYMISCYLIGSHKTKTLSRPRKD